MKKKFKKGEGSKWTSKGIWKMFQIHLPLPKSNSGSYTGWINMWPWYWLKRLIPHLTFHVDGVPPHLQVLAVVRFIAEGTHQKGLGNDYNHPMSQSTVSKYMHQVIPAINALSREFIRFPSNHLERQVISRRWVGIDIKRVPLRTYT